MRHVFVIATMALLCVACKNNKKGTGTTDTGTTTTTTNMNTTGVKGWPDSTKTAFITECINNSKGKMPEDQARKVCTCMQEKIEAQYPNYSDASALTMQQMNDMAKDCVK